MNKKVESQKKSRSKKTHKHDFETLDPFFNNVDADDDFARIVVGGAKIDACLASLLDKFLVDGGTKDDFLSHSGVGGTFSARAALCYTVGLISGTAYTDMVHLANLRNYTAHNPNKVSFKDDFVVEKINELKWLFAWIHRNYGDNPKLTEQFENNPHVKYFTTIGLMCYELNHRARALEKRQKYEEPLSMIHMKLLDKDRNVLNELPDHIKKWRDENSSSAN